MPRKEKLVPLICKRSLQPLLHKMYLFALTGMNYGNANTMDHEKTGEKKVIEYVQEKVAAEAFTLFDVGANAGNYALLAADTVKDKQLHIFAFEPSRHSFRLLTDNTAPLFNIHLYNAGLGQAEETVNLYSNYEGSGATTVYNAAFEQYHQNKNIVEQVQLQTLDGFCEKNSVEVIDLLKIDVEGHELPVLLGAEKMLKRGAIKFIQFEFGSAHIYSKTFFKDFWDLLSPQYTIYRVITNGLFELKSYSENLEIFRTANFLAQLK
jgi:FkbM family methyltransferase